MCHDDAPCAGSETCEPQQGTTAPFAFGRLLAPEEVRPQIPSRSASE